MKSKNEIAEMGCYHILENYECSFSYVDSKLRSYKMKVKTELEWELNLRTRGLIKAVLDRPKFLTSFLKADHQTWQPKEY